MPDNLTFDMNQAQPVKAPLTFDMSKAVAVQQPQGAWERFTAGLKSAIPSWQAGGISNAIDQQLQQQVLSPQQNPLTWEHLKAAFNASPVGMAVHGNLAGAGGAVLPGAVMAGAMMAGGPAAPKGEAAPPTEQAPGATRNAVANALRVASDIVDPDVTGLISPRAAHLQRTLGRIADRMQGQPETVPAAQTAAPESMTATAPMPAGRVQPTVSMKINPDVQLWQGTTAEVAGPKPTAAPQKAGSVAAAPTQDAIDLAKALGAGTPAKAEARFGKEAWDRMVRGKDVVADAVDAAVSAGKVNDAATNVAGAALATGNIQHAQDVIQAAAQVPVGKGPESMPPTDFQLQPRNPNGTLAQQPTRALQWEDFLDDKAWKNRMEADYGTDLGPAPEKNWGPSQYIAQAYQEAVPTSRSGRAAQTEEVKAGIERARPDEAKSTLADIARQTVGAAKPEFKFAVGDAVKFAGGSGTVTRISPEFGTVQVDTGGNLPRLFGAGELKLSSGRGAQRRAAP